MILYFKADSNDKDTDNSNNRMKLRRVEVFEPSGIDVYFSSLMLFAQFIDMAIRALGIYKQLS